jgi:hypothetical protein
MTKSEEWSRRVREQRESGLSIAAYCRREGLTTSGFDCWRGKLRGEVSGFVAVGQQSEAPIAIELRSGAVIRIRDTTTLRAVLEVLDAQS